MTIDSTDVTDTLSTDQPVEEGEHLWYEGGTFVVPSYCGSSTEDIEVLPKKTGSVGLSYFAVGPDLFITGVEKGGSCEEAGVIAGSKLVAVNGISLREGGNRHGILKNEILKSQLVDASLVLRCIPPGVSRREIIECNGEFFSVPTYVMS
eukprot:TRINITY_DN33653_c0_g1_i1.p1 TRINITY_DN33653_c0_g1~~TRINITY_DN33653_c0_g1_i1.p1  ORF type:complete len:150 (+),score=28.40 TRINITY_DN33653_c0_g1_i1:90-539(+)